MEAIILIGIPGSGKSTWYKENCFNTHIRISLDLLNTRNKMNKMIDWCLQFQAACVIDNTNVSAEERRGLIERFKSKGYRVKGVYFSTTTEQCLMRNKRREGKERVKEAAIFSKLKELNLPALTEGLDELITINNN